MKTTYKYIKSGTFQQALVILLKVEPKGVLAFLVCLAGQIQWILVWIHLYIVQLAPYT